MCTGWLCVWDCKFICVCLCLLVGISQSQRTVCVCVYLYLAVQDSSSIPPSVFSSFALFAFGYFGFIVEVETRHPSLYMSMMYPSPRPPFISIVYPRCQIRLPCVLSASLYTACSKWSFFESKNEEDEFVVPLFYLVSGKQEKEKLLIQLNVKKRWIYKMQMTVFCSLKGPIKAS